MSLPTIIFDLDYTLLDTLAMKIDMRRALASVGVAPIHFDMTIEKLHCDPGTGALYDPHAHVRLLREESPYGPSEAEMLGALLGVAEKAGDFLYPGAADVLTRLKATGHRLVLVSYGDQFWQQAKLDGSGLKPFFAEIRLTNSPKKDILSQVLEPGETAIFVNDNVAETTEVLTAHPQLVAVLRSGAHPLPKGVGLPTVETFEQLEAFVAAHVQEIKKKVP